MKITSLLTLVSLISSAVAVYVTSADGTNIWAESTGDPTKPAVVFIPGFSCSSLAFDKQWGNSFMESNLFMVRDPLPPSPLLWSSIIQLNLLCRSDMTSVVKESATSL